MHALQNESQTHNLLMLIILFYICRNVHCKNFEGTYNTGVHSWNSDCSSCLLFYLDDNVWGDWPKEKSQSSFHIASTSTMIINIYIAEKKWMLTLMAYAAATQMMTEVFFCP